MRLLEPFKKILEIYPNYSLSMLLLELVTLPIFIYSSGSSYFFIKNFLQCSSFACYRFAFIASLLPGSFFTGLSFGLLQGFLKIDYSNLDKLPQEQVTATILFSKLTQREKAVCLLALGTFTVSVSTVLINKQKRKNFKYYVQTLPLRIKTKKRNFKYKIANSFTLLRNRL